MNRFVKTALAAAPVVAIGGVFAKLLPQLRRYLRIRRM